MPRRPGIALALAACLGPLVAAQPSDLPTEAVVRALAAQARADARGDNEELVLALDARARERWGDFETFPITIVRTESLLVELSAPYMTYRLKLAQYLPIRRPLAEVPWIPTAVVTITPERIDAADITRVVVERNGEEVPPVDARLKSMSFVNGAGDRAMIHAGEVHFPMAAFAPAGTVTVSAVAATGSSFGLELSEAQLRTFK